MQHLLIALSNQSVHVVIGNNVEVAVVDQALDLVLQRIRRDLSSKLRLYGVTVDELQTVSVHGFFDDLQ